MLKGHVFSKQIFENQIFALFINTFLNSTNGISQKYKNGMNLSYTNQSVTIDSGCVCIQGRFLEEDSSSTLQTSNSSLYCKLIIEINLDEVNTETELKQSKYKIITSTLNYPELTQNDIVNEVAGIYQYELARFRTSELGISDFQDMRTYLDFESIYDEIRKKGELEFNEVKEEFLRVLNMLKDELEEVKNGTSYIFKNDMAVITVKTISGIYPSEEAYIIDYPEGFNGKNCFIISFMKDNGNGQYSTIRGTGNDYCYLDNSQIIIYNVSFGISYRIVLLKIPVYENILLGDINFDGVVNNKDLELIKGFIDGTVALTSKQLQAADINGDGEVKTTDYILLKNQLVSQYQLGDINMDGVINQEDLTLLQNHLTNPQAYPLNTIQLALADVNKDGFVDSEDTSKLTQYINGIIDSLE